MRRGLVKVSFGVVLTVAAAGCVTTRGAKDATKDGVVHFEPVMVVGDLELDKLNDEELMTAGESFYAAQDYKQAARYYGRIADFHPNSPHRNKALYNAGRSHEQLNEYDEALQRYSEIANAETGKGDALDAAFKVAKCQFYRAEIDEALRVLRVIHARTDLGWNHRLDALMQAGTSEFLAGRTDAGEATLRKVLSAWQELSDPDEVDRGIPGQAQFYIGEVYRTHYESVTLNPDKGVDVLSRDLEYKAELLLSAQGHYLRAIRIGDGGWATAAASQIGGMYENLYDHMVNASAPKELNREEAEVYRDELRKKIRILLTKAISIYERTLETAERIGAQNNYVDETRVKLQRVKELLLAEARSEEPPMEEPPAAEGQTSDEEMPPPPAATKEKKPRS